MPVRSHTARGPRPTNTYKTPYPVKEAIIPPNQQQTQHQSQQQPQERSVPDIAISNIKSGLKKAGTYIQKNQDAYYKAHPQENPFDTSWEEDLCNIPGRVARKTGEFGEENRLSIRAACRQDPNIGEFKRQPPNPEKLQFVVKSHKPQNKSSGSQQSSERHEPNRRQRRPRQPRQPRNR